jgi:hypothetical protein
MTDKLSDSVTISPVGSMDLLSQMEVAKLRDVGSGDLRERFRRCALAVLNTGGMLDDARAVYERFADFEIELLQVERGIRLRMQNAPAQAFVEGELIHGIREHLVAVLRDVIYVSNEIEGRNGLDSPAAITDAVFQILRNARALRTRTPPDLVVCWGGHSIGREEYDYSKSVGYHLGLRGLNVCTGCGPGARPRRPRSVSAGSDADRSVRRRPPAAPAGRQRVARRSAA